MIKFLDDKIFKKKLLKQINTRELLLHLWRMIFLFSREHSTEYFFF